MRKALFNFVMVVLGLYLILHLILGSSPVQRRVVEEIRRALSEYGLDLQIESIEFSAFTPKIYLNRVTLRPLPHRESYLSSPLPIDKIKIEFQPIALISKRIVIEEAVLFHPRVILPEVDTLYRKLSANTKEKKKKEASGGFFKLVVKKFGVVDALFDIRSHEPALTVRSRSFSAFVENAMGQQQTITVSSNNLEVDRNALKLNLTGVELDVDVSKKSLRVNRAVIEADDLYVNIKGASSVPTGSIKTLTSLSASYEIRLPLKLLRKIPEVAASAPELEGKINTMGTVRLINNQYVGSGTLKYDGLFVEGYRLGAGSLAYALSEKKLNVSNVDLQYGGGTITSKGLSLELKDHYALNGDLVLKEVHLESILEGLKNPGTPVRLRFDGPMAVKGTLKDAFEIDGDFKGRFSGLKALKEDSKGVTEDNTIVSVDSGTMDAQLSFLSDRMLFQANLGLLQGALHGEGFISYDNVAKVRARGEKLSLTQLRHIAELDLGGTADLVADLDVQGKDVKVGGSFEVAGAEISSMVLGKVNAQAHYQSNLLTFENVEAATSLEPVKGNGFVDFAPKDTHYKFQVEGRRVLVDDVFKMFQKKKLTFPAPKGGELAARLSIEGGHDRNGLEIVTTGQAKNFRWYDEDWLSTNFAVTFRTPYTEVNRILLMKKSGGLEIKAKFEDNWSQMDFISHNLHVEELDQLGKSPLAAQITGQLHLEGKMSSPTGSGEIHFSNTSFRGNALPDSTVKVRTLDEGGLEILARLFGDSLRGRLARESKAGKQWNLLLYLDNLDMAPLATMAMGKDIPTLSEISASGNINLNGDFSNWQTFRGSGALNTFSLGLRGTPMKNTQPLEIRVDEGAVKVNRFSLVGKDSQFSLDFLYQPDRQVKASLDGKVDLQYLQPFIPALEYGTGKVSAGLRLSGKPPNFDLFGNVSVEDGTFRVAGLTDEFRGAQVQLTVSQDRINVDRFEATVNGGSVEVDGDIRINRFKNLIPNLKIAANRVAMKSGTYLTTRFSGDFFLRGNSAPYLLGGKCRIQEARLTQFATSATEVKDDSREPVIKFDVTCDAKDHLYVNTNVMNAEFKGNFHLLGTDSKIGLLGGVESIGGSILFRDRKFTLNSGNVRFESASKIAPRFSVSGRSLVKESTSSSQTSQVQTSQEYEVNLQVFGTPDKYKILLTSSPELAEADIISLLLLGTTSLRQDGNYMDLGTTIVGQVPLQSKLESQLGVDIRINTQSRSSSPNSTVPTVPTTATSSTSVNDITVPSVKIQKDITKRTKVSYSNTLGSVPLREFKIEHILDDNITVNGVAADRLRGTDTQTTNQSYGIDFRYRFQFE